MINHNYATLDTQCEYLLNVFTYRVVGYRQQTNSLAEGHSKISKQFLKCIFMCHKSVGVGMDREGPQRDIKKVSLTCTEDSVLKEKRHPRVNRVQYIHLH